MAGKFYLGDGGPATDAAFNFPTGVAVDASGNLYIADQGNQRIRKVDANGTISTVAGNGTSGYSGDGGPATSAQLKDPSNVAVDANGNLYIADGNNRIRKVSASGIITTVAGDGTGGFSGDAGPATSAQLNDPIGVAVDTSGNLYIADRFNHRIRKVDASGTITTVAGDGTYGYSGDGGPATSAELNFPIGIAVDASGNLYIADQSNNRIRKVTAGGTITTVAGDGTSGYSGDSGPAISAQLDAPAGVTVDAGGNLYIADHNNYRLRKVNGGGIITTVTGDGTGGYSGDGGPAARAELDGLTGVAVGASGNLYIVDQYNQRIREVNAGGIISTAAGRGYSGDGGPATGAGLNLPTGIAVDDASGSLYIADQYNQRVRKVGANGIITTVAGNGRGGYGGDGGMATSAEIKSPTGVAVDANGNLYIVDDGNACIRKVDTSGIITTVAGDSNSGFGGDGGPATGAKLDLPTGVAIDVRGNIYIADEGNNRIRKVDVSGIITTVAGDGTRGDSGDGGPATSAQLNDPIGVAVDLSGNIYIADWFNHRIRKVDATGIITTVAGDGTYGYSGDGGPATGAKLAFPTGVAVDASGNLYIADGNNYRIRKVDPSGIIITVAGNGTGGYSGDGGPAISAQLDAPAGVTIDGNGNLYIADEQNNLIRLVSSSIPAAPTGLTAQVGNAQVTLSWAAGSGAATYNVYLGTAVGGEAAIPIESGIAGTSTTITGLTNGTTYYFTVAAINSAAKVIAGGLSAPSNEVSATPTVGYMATTASPGGGGGILDVDTLLSLAAWAAVRRLRRTGM